MDFPDRLAPDKADNLLTKKTKRLWPATTELIGLEFELEVISEGTFDAAYARGLHAWLLDQIRQIDPELSQRMHDRPDEKGFTISRLRGELVETDNGFFVKQGETLYWSVSGIDRQVVEGLHQLLKSGVRALDQRVVQLRMRACRVELAATTYSELMAGELRHQVTLSFLSATAFRRKKQHFPLPVPFNIMQSYLRRWEPLSGEYVEREAFLDWVDRCVVVQRHQVETCLVAAGKRGLLTGFTGGVTFAVAKEGMEELEFVQLFGRLGRFAAYCGTGHKTALGLGQTRQGWLLLEGERVVVNAAQVLEERIALLKEVFYGQRKRQGGDRAERTAQVWATVLARRELGEPTKDIAEDMGLQYETAKTYVKLARRALRQGAV